ncbi:PaaI family thioesterase [Trinickia dinghuensis]|uniref:Medium/long-chain acyl-CoA thioesterase YigI n=1 Tax=Trinickia dinghuensis TaxID=2291023 RepID=A0A3D8K694_9BURK|nr:PaaI family thioesterase [Trinickia dinghuensis]RDV00839.1 PaaI family thioesterase [Trinickia dinghuensis]
MTDFFDLARSALHAQPFSTLLGTELVEIGEREVTLRLPIRDELRQQQGFVHGGVTSYLADNALTFAGALALGPRVVTAEYKINYLRPAVRGTLLAHAELIYAGRGHAICQCRIVVVDGEKEALVALAQGTINRVGDGPNASLPHADHEMHDDERA